MNLSNKLFLYNFDFFKGNKLFNKIIFLVLISLICSSSESRLYKKLSKKDAHHTHYKGHYKIGKEYKVKNKSYKPAVNINYNKVGMASWYGSKDGFHGKKTANSERYDKNVLMPSLVKVTNLSNNKSLIVKVNYRGPFSKKRIIDVSEQAAKILGFKQQGVAKVRVQYLHPRISKKHRLGADPS